MVPLGTRVLKGCNISQLIQEGSVGVSQSSLWQVCTFDLLEVLKQRYTFCVGGLVYVVEV